MFKIKKKLKNKLGRVGEFITPNGIIETPAFIVVGTKAAVKSLSPEQVGNLGAQAVLGNTYHLYLQPGDDIIKKAGGLNKFMNWNGPTFTDSGGFQVFSLGAGFGSNENKFEFQKNISNHSLNISDKVQSVHTKLVKINEDGVEFRSCIDGSRHFFTPEKSIEIQNNIGADIIFAFDECVSSSAEYNYQKEAMERTHRWAKRSLNYNNNHRLEVQLSSGNKQALFGIVQGGKFEDLRKKSAKIIGKMDFDGFGIGGSFSKEGLDKTLHFVNDLLPKEKIKHLLGIGEPSDLFIGIENGIDSFDCVSPTRIARTGMLYTKHGRINIIKVKYSRDFSKIEDDCKCYTCENYTKAYLSHLFRAQEMFASTLASIHNLYFIVNLVKNIRQSILDEKFYELKEEFLKKYYE
ncbi:tRNA-guanine(34) transglycosylase [Candidatus Campbellbacteria bacterium RIFCSPLOWO2_02_35_12]|uniref:Queuine tRNA-ribosyltransferase n=1 Tax=Candidatus Campbellbacteria bacterium RIFCSPLOWO2_02_35_12 TaxID=1797580 RepID=A0A1F5EHF4_9BACT|nr:MAG: tRNA-guanine(34) transglycosylase [Candidatus Campbellbacteria bacterium RIFCSPLOWO2_02_35_12]